MIFLKEFLKNTKEIGSIIPSSRFLSKAMVSEINHQNADVVVELGAGTGVFTEMLANSLNSNTKLFVFELNPSLYKVLCEKFSHNKNIFILNQSAEDLNEVLSSHGVEKIDYVLSGLPFLNFPPEIKNSIFKSVQNSLKTDGKLILFQYTRFLEKEFETFFEINSVKKIFLNFPPANIYTLGRKR